MMDYLESLVDLQNHYFGFVALKHDRKWSYFLNNLSVCAYHWFFCPKSQKSDTSHWYYSVFRPPRQHYSTCSSGFSDPWSMSIFRVCLLQPFPYNTSIKGEFFARIPTEHHKDLCEGIMRRVYPCKRSWKIIHKNKSKWKAVHTRWEKCYFSTKFGIAGTWTEFQKLHF